MLQNIYTVIAVVNDRWCFCHDTVVNPVTLSLLKVPQVYCIFFPYLVDCNIFIIAGWLVDGCMPWMLIWIHSALLYTIESVYSKGPAPLFLWKWTTWRIIWLFQSRCFCWILIRRPAAFDSQVSNIRCAWSSEDLFFFLQRGGGLTWRTGATFPM